MVVLSKSYNFSSNREGKQYLGLDLDWNYEKRKVHLSMLTYFDDALKRFNNKKTATVPALPAHQTIL